jgi:hypothetical protein
LSGRFWLRRFGGEAAEYQPVANGPFAGNRCRPEALQKILVASVAQLDRAFDFGKKGHSPFYRDSNFHKNMEIITYL